MIPAPFQGLFPQMCFPRSLQATALILLAGLMVGCQSPHVNLSTADLNENEAESSQTGWSEVNLPAQDSVISPAESPIAESPTTEVLAAETPAAESSAIEAVFSPLEAGRHCYQLKTKSLDEVIRLDVTADFGVTGETTGTIANEAAGYYSSYERKFAGQLSGDRLPVQLTTWIEYDVQQEQETWEVSSQQLKTEREQFQGIDCWAVQDRFTHASGLEASDLTDGAANIHRDRIQFAPGTTSTTIENGVIRGDRDLYLMGAQGGQVMNLAITSLENNAVFDVVTPSGIILKTEADNAELLLPHTGDYQIIVGGTRGNASYSLQVEIR